MITNDFHLAVRYGELIPLRPITHMTKEQGLRLAAWIVFLVDPDQETFGELLEELLGEEEE